MISIHSFKSRFQPLLFSMATAILLLLCSFSIAQTPTSALPDNNKSISIPSDKITLLKEAILNLQTKAAEAQQKITEAKLAEAQFTAKWFEICGELGQKPSESKLDDKTWQIVHIPLPTTKDKESVTNKK